MSTSTMGAARWTLSHKADKRALPLADRHYSRQSPGALQFVSPGRSLVLLTPAADALWVATWPRFAAHAWPGAWICSLFRNEGPLLSSTLITAALAICRWRWGPPPPHGCITFIDPAAVRPKPHPGYCFRMAGFREAGLTTERRRLVLQLLPQLLPPPAEPAGLQLPIAL
jgi:hypothetical protein